MEKIVRKIVSGWYSSPPITVVNSTTELPFYAPDDVRGAYRIKTKEAFIVSNNHFPSEIAGTIAHEVIGHHGVRVHKHGFWRSFMFGIQDGLRQGDKNLSRYRSHVKAAYIDEAGNFNLTPVQEADEIVASIVETKFDGASGRLKIDHPFSKQWLAMRRHISRESLYLDRPVSFEEVEGVALAAEHRLRHGDAFFGIGRRLKEWYSPEMPKYNPSKPPMSVEESQRLLKAEDDRVRWWRDLKFGFDGIVLIACMIILPLCVLGMLYGLFSPLFK